jgi:cysteine desulfurase/selenocysteine lyase
LLPRGGKLIGPNPPEPERGIMSTSTEAQVVSNPNVEEQPAPRMSPVVLAGTASAIDVWSIREDFPILKQVIRGKPLVYLDNAASTQKPKVVVDAICTTYLTEYANIHRGVHLLSELCTKAYEDTRVVIQRFINAASSKEIIFVRGATEGINLVAQTFGRKNVGAGDEILITWLEHHSNIVPWQMLCEEKGARLRVAPINDRGEVLIDEFEKLLGPRTRLVAVGHVSNALGTVNPIKQMIEMAHGQGIPVLVDGAQAIPHLKIDVRELDADFYTFSGHKMYGPSGIGVLYGKQALLEDMPPYQGGGDMISSVTFEKTTYNSLPYKFEAGTPNIGGTIGLGAAIDYLNRIGLGNIAAYEHELLEYGTALLSEIPGVRIVGTAADKAAVLSFVMDGIHPHDIGTILDQEGIAVRTGHHCAQPVMDRFQIPATARASLAFYNTPEEIDKLGAGIRGIKEVFG